MAFKPTSKTIPDPDEIILFTGKNYTGDTYSAIIGDNINIPVIQNELNDKFYSVKVGSATKVTKPKGKGLLDYFDDILEKIKEFFKPALEFIENLKKIFSEKALQLLTRVMSFFEGGAFHHVWWRTAFFLLDALLE